MPWSAALPSSHLRQIYGRAVRYTSALSVHAVDTKFLMMWNVLAAFEVVIAVEVAVDMSLSGIEIKLCSILTGMVYRGVLQPALSNKTLQEM